MAGLHPAVRSNTFPKGRRGSTFEGIPAQLPIEFCCYAVLPPPEAQGPFDFRSPLVRHCWNWGNGKDSDVSQLFIRWRNPDESHVAVLHDFMCKMLADIYMFCTLTTLHTNDMISPFDAYGFILIHWCIILLPMFRFKLRRYMGKINFFPFSDFLFSDFFFIGFRV